MRTIKFDPIELSVLKEIIFLGNSQYKNDFPEIADLILSKVRIEIFDFSKKEILVLKSYCSNWINENDELIDELRKKYLENDDIDYKNIKELDKKHMQKISIVFSIKSKLFLKSYIAFKKVLEKV
ncbi:hypothetical protein [Flavobacterium gelatinilyticum]|uniref:hypothetical protein n=1 Tax=Flavobacterium gelatinilyticum TaxID=3003260 RepID=UPI002480C3E2|nr:hypothetical protein [Flavobacterium gelatinilyticum]